MLDLDQPGAISELTQVNFAATEPYTLMPSVQFGPGRQCMYFDVVVVSSLAVVAAICAFMGGFVWVIRKDMKKHPHREVHDK